MVKNKPEKKQITTEDAENICKEKGIYWGGEWSAKDFSVEQLKEMFTKFNEEIFKKVGANNSKGGAIVKSDPKPKKYKC